MILYIRGDDMAIYDVYYRIKRDKNSDVEIRMISANNKESAKLIAKSIIGDKYTIIRIKKV